MIPLANKEYESYLNRIYCHIGKKKFEHKYTNNKQGRSWRSAKGAKAVFQALVKRCVFIAALK